MNIPRKNLLFKLEEKFVEMEKLVTLVIDTKSMFPEILDTISIFSFKRRNDFYRSTDESFLYLIEFESLEKRNIFFKHLSRSYNDGLVPEAFVYSSNRYMNVYNELIEKEGVLIYDLKKFH